MITICGIILLEKAAIVIRIYEVNKREWKLIHYQNFQTEPEETNTLLADFFTTQDARYVTQWKTGARELPQATINHISSALGLEIENITLHREQELLSKGLFTELW